MCLIEHNVVGFVEAKIIESKTANCAQANPMVNRAVQGEAMVKDVEGHPVLRRLQAPPQMLVAKLALRLRQR